MKITTAMEYAVFSLAICVAHFILMDYILGVGDIYQVDWAEFVLKGSVAGALPSSWYAPVLSYLIRGLTKTFGFTLKYGLWIHLVLLEIGQFFLMFNACFLLKSARGLLFALLPFLFLFTALFYPLSRDGVFTLTVWALIHLFIFYKLRQSDLGIGVKIGLLAFMAVLVVFGLWIRQNGFLLIVPLVIGAVLWESRRQVKKRIILAGAVAVLLVAQAAFYQILIQTSDADLVNPANAFIGHDLMAISLDQNKNLIPLELIHHGKENQYLAIFESGTEAEQLAVYKKLFHYEESDSIFLGKFQLESPEPNFKAGWTNRIISHNHLGNEIYVTWARTILAHPWSYLKQKARAGGELILNARLFWTSEDHRADLDNARTAFGFVTKSWLIQNYNPALRRSDFDRDNPWLGQAFYTVFYSIWKNTPFLKHTAFNFLFYLIFFVYLIVKGIMALKAGRKVFYPLLFLAAAGLFFITLIPFVPFPVWKYLFPVAYAEMAGGIYLFLNRRGIIEL